MRSLFLFSRKKQETYKFTLKDNDTFGCCIAFSGRQLRGKNRISPTVGGMKFPERFFDERSRILSEAECRALLDMILESGYASWKSDCDRPAQPEAPGRSEPSSFVFIRSGQLEASYYSDRPCSEFHALCRRLRSYLNLPDIIQDIEEATEAADKAEKQSCIVCNECKTILLPTAIFCPACGCKVEAIIPADTDISDLYFENTLWRCEACMEGNLFEHRFCMKCGKRRSW